MGHERESWCHIMLDHVVRFSIRNRGVVIALSCLMVGYGLFIASHSKLDVFPEFAPPQIVIQTESPGLSPEEVEKLVTRPIEVSVNGAAGLETLRSQSIQGLSVITAIFQDKADIFRARQLVSERLIEAARMLPQTVHAPIMAPLTSSTSLVLIAGLNSESQSLRDLRTFADYEMKPRLLGVPGVAKVVVYGGEVRQLQIQIVPERLKSYGISIQEVADAAAKATGVRGAGFIETATQRIVLRTEGQSLAVSKLGEAVVRRSQGITVRLKDLGHVVEGTQPKLGDAQIQGKSGVSLLISAQYGANTLEVTERLEKAFQELEPLLKAQGILLSPDLFKPAQFINTSIHNVTVSLLIGGLLVCAVLFLFLWNIRISLISLTAIPLSLLIAIVILDLLGISLNTLTLGGFAIAIGEVVDDAIIDVENIHRRLKENEKSSHRISRLKVVYLASLEVRSAVVYATFIVILVFLPVIRLSGIQGKLFAPFGFAYIYSILASLLVALTLTPALSATLLKSLEKEQCEPRWVKALKDFYQVKLSQILVRPKKVGIAVFLLCLGALATFPFFGGAFLPEFREGHFIIHMSAIPGTSLQESMRLGKQVTQELLKLSEVRSVSQQVGRSEKSDDTWGVHYSEINVDLKPLAGEEAEAVQSKIRKALSQFPGVYFAIKSFLTERIEETISGSTAQVVIKLFGEDLDVLDQKSKEIMQLLTKIEGATDVQMESQPSVPQFTVKLKMDRLTQLGFQPTVVLDAIQSAYHGAYSSQIFEGNRVFDVVVLLDDSLKKDPEVISELMLRNPDGAWFPLKELADVQSGTGRYVILHENTHRRQAVTCNVGGRDLASFTNEVRKRIGKEISFPGGTYPVIGGAAEAQSQAQKELWVFSLMAGSGIILLLWTVFKNGRNLLLVLSNLPFALVGGVLAVFFTGGWLSLGSLVGFVTLFGITTRNSIMLISHYEHLVDKEEESWGTQTAIRGAAERLLPILMTASVTALGLLPIALGSGEPGREIEGPMATVILGGLLSSTALNLLVLPSLALRYGRFTKISSEETW